MNSIFRKTLSPFTCILFSIPVLLLQWNCRDNPVDAPARNPREYTWTIETLSVPGSPQTLMQDMYAVDSKNIWVVGHNSRAFGQMFHYDGNSWNWVSLSFGAFDLTSIVGFGKNDIWAVGVKWPQNDPVGLIIHYDGNYWNELKVDGMNRLLCVWGSSSRDLWFAGLDGTLMHYDGVSVGPDSIPRAIPEHADWGFYTGASGPGGSDYALLVGQPLDNHVAWSYVYRRQSARWVFLDSANGVINRLWQSPWGKLYRTGYGIGYWNETEWKFLNLYGAFTRGVYGIAEDNMFAVGTSVWHWNGNDWYEFTNLPAQRIVNYKVWTDGREVFIVGVGLDDDNSYVLHGK